MCEPLEVTFLATAIALHDVYQMPNTTTEFRITQAIHNSSLSVRDRHTFTTPPDQDCAIDPCARDSEEAKLMVKQQHRAGADMRCSHHKGGAEKLFGQSPILGSAPAADIARRESLLCEHPRVFRYHGPTGLDLEREDKIKTPARAEQPTPACKGCKLHGSGST